MVIGNSLNACTYYINTNIIIMIIAIITTTTNEEEEKKHFVKAFHYIHLKILVLKTSIDHV